MPALSLVDLDQRPELRPVTASLFAACPPGHNHQVCGFPELMGLDPRVSDFEACLGVLIAMHGIRLVGALALCPYSPQQVTLWGPVVPEVANVRPVSARLIKEARVALRNAGYESMRCLVDSRNRAARSTMQGHGFSAWKENHLYEHRLENVESRESPSVRRATKADHVGVARVLNQGFPESDHCKSGLGKREKDGFRHYVLEHAGRIVAAAAVDGLPRRSWLKLIAVEPESRGKKFSTKLLAGILAAEAKLQASALALEVLADNAPACALYEHAGFDRRFTTSILTAAL